MITTPVASDNYVPLAVRTESPSFHPICQHVLETNLVEVGLTLAGFDGAKRQCFYGKPMGILECHPIILSVTQQRLLHSLLGILTEAGELQQGLHKTIFQNQPLDTTNLKEELGDLLWYIALACDAAGLTLNEVLQANIAKLQARFPDKFDQGRAIVRDLEAEHKALNWTRLEEK